METKDGKLSKFIFCPTVTDKSGKQADNLGGSGVQLVYAQILFATVGALALQKGGVVANTVARKRILEPLGLMADP